MREYILGVGFDSLTVDTAADRALALMAEGRGGFVCTPNPEMVWRSRKNEALRHALNRADMVLPDGVGILWASEILGGGITQRAAGYDFLVSLLGKMNGSVYLLGGRAGVAEKAAAVISERWPQVTVAGTHDGWFSDDAGVLAEIEGVRPDLLVVCLGSPKQELWMDEMAGRGLPVGLMAGLGGSLDVLSGNVKRAPAWWIDHGLEWLYRLLREPKRIKRQLCLPLYVTAVLMKRVKYGKGKTDRP